MATQVIKRDGCQAIFAPARIAAAIHAAAQAAQISNQDYCASAARLISHQLMQRPQVNIAEVQQAVENQLMAGRCLSPSASAPAGQRA